ncbi:DUF7742 family protein [Octadecabacter ascidiaceicola]|uniref:DUF7742 family protein n=1 Tax=Octadecabacter ascidiaceicola TaxID=1655543 RepID=UPI00117EE7CC|nr:hypothetical protein [Octadecabacter ascidiaceicola]
MSDLDIATRVLLAMPREHWFQIAAKLIEDAHTADLWRKRQGCTHPNGGTGSLYAQASLHQRAGTPRNSARYCAALTTLLCALDAWRNRVHSET